jgi:hypothetical protein
MSGVNDTAWQRVMDLKAEVRLLREIVDAGARTVDAVQEMHLRDVAQLRAALKEACDLGVKVIDTYGQWDYDDKLAAKYRIEDRLAELRKLAEET